MRKRLHLIIHGHVQGVCFRAFIQQNTTKLSLKGFARNLDNGTVELIAEGEEENLKQLLQLCKKGPESAEVTTINTNWQEYKDEFKEFSIN